MAKRHNSRYTGTYSSWAAMKSRCSDVNNAVFHRYGGNGIAVCERWHDFRNFLEDMGHRPVGYSIDRIDNNLGYFKDNCKWSNTFEQAANRSSSIVIDHNGIADTVSGWARRIGCDDESLMRRVKSGWSISDALSIPFSKNTPSRKTPRIEHDGQSLTLKQWSKISGIPDDTIRYRLKTGWSVKDAIFSERLTNVTRHTKGKPVTQ